MTEAEALPTPHVPGDYTFSPTPSAFVQSEGPLAEAGRQLQQAAITGKAVPELTSDAPIPTAQTVLESGGHANATGVSDDAALAAAFVSQSSLNQTSAAQELERPAVAPLATTPGAATAAFDEPASNVAAPADDLPDATAVDGAKLDTLPAVTELAPPEPMLADNASHRAVVGAPLVMPSEDAQAPPVTSPVDDEGRTHAQRIVHQVGQEDAASAPVVATASASKLPPALSKYDYTPREAIPTTPDANVADYQSVPSGLHVAGDPASADAVPAQVATVSDHVARDHALIGGGALGADALAAQTATHVEASPADTGNTPLATAVPATTAHELEALNEPVANIALTQGVAAAPTSEPGPTGLKALGFNVPPPSEQRADPPHVQPQAAQPADVSSTTPVVEHVPRASHEGEHPRKLHTHRHPPGTPPKEGKSPVTVPAQQVEDVRRNSAASAGKKSGFFKKVFHRKDKSTT